MYLEVSLSSTIVLCLIFQIEIIKKKINYNYNINQETDRHRL